MASLFPFRLPPSSSSILPLLFFFLLFKCCCSQSDGSGSFSLRGFACAKKDAALNGGTFIVVGEKRLRVDPSQLTTDGNKAKIDALRLDPKDMRLVMSVVFPNGGEGCRPSFLARVQMPSACDAGENVTVFQGQDRFGEICDSTKCALLNVTCNLHQMSSVESLPNARHFTMSLWKNVSDDTENALLCDWKAFIDDVVVLLNKAETRPELLVEQCWQKDVLEAKKIFLYAAIGGAIVIVALIVIVLILLVSRRQSKTASHTLEIDEDIDHDMFRKRERLEVPMGRTNQMSMSAGPSTIASEFGVEVPESLLSDVEDSGRAPFAAPTQRLTSAPEKKTAASQFGVEVPESMLLNSSARQKTTQWNPKAASRFGVEVPDSLRSDSEDDDSMRSSLAAQSERPTSSARKPMPSNEMYAPLNATIRYGAAEKKLQKDIYSPLPPI